MGLFEDHLADPLGCHFEDHLVDHIEDLFAVHLPGHFAELLAAHLKCLFVHKRHLRPFLFLESDPISCKNGHFAIFTKYMLYIVFYSSSNFNKQYT